MSHDSHARHPFLDDLTPDAEFHKYVLRRPVSGREDIKTFIGTVAALYKTPVFLETVGSRSFLQYEAVLTNGMSLTGVGVIERNADAGVHHVSCHDCTRLAQCSRCPASSVRSSTMSLAKACSSESPHGQATGGHRVDPTSIRTVFERSQRCPPLK